MTATAICPDCGASYSGRREHCRGGPSGGCCQTFNSTWAGDMHRVGDFASAGKLSTRRCLTPAEMVAKGMTQSRGVWYGPGRDARSRPAGNTQGSEQDPTHGAVAPRCICGPDVTGEAPDERSDCPAHQWNDLMDTGEVPF